MSHTANIAIPERNWDSWQFRLIFTLSFVVYLVAAVSTRLTPNHWRTDATHRSIFSEAWEASGTTAQIAFAG